MPKTVNLTITFEEKTRQSQAVNWDGSNRSLDLLNKCKVFDFSYLNGLLETRKADITLIQPLGLKLFSYLVTLINEFKGNLANAVNNKRLERPTIELESLIEEIKNHYKIMKSIKKIIYVLIFQLLLFTPSIVNAYGLEGHLSILDIALSQLSAKKQANITFLLSNILNQLDDSEKDLDPIIAASWLDNMHNIEVLNKIHFSGKIIHNSQNIPLPENANTVLFYKLDLYWNLQNTIYALTQHKLDPKNHPLSKFKQSLLLMYLVHLVGDAHQPLHVIEPLYKVYKTDSNPYGKTSGANLILVNTSHTGKCQKTKKLHAIWDDMGCLTEKARKQYPPKTGTEQEYFINAEKFFAKYLVKDFVINIVKSATIDPKKYQMGFDTQTWVNDLKQFDGNVFNAIDADIAKLKTATDEIVLTDDYLNNVKQTTINLVYLAGLRLGYILNSVF